MSEAKNIAKGLNRAAAKFAEMAAALIRTAEIVRELEGLTPEDEDRFTVREAQLSDAMRTGQVAIESLNRLTAEHTEVEGVELVSGGP